MPKILIIDDEIEIRSILSSLLSKKGYSCIEAHSAEEAKDVLGRDDVALALVDVDLPGESGITFLEYARSTSPDTILMMVTGMEEDDTISAAINAGIYAYVLKPFNKNQLLLLVKNALRQREIEIENRHYREGLEEMLASRIESLKQSEAKLEAITASAYDPIILADDDGKIQFWNQAAQKVFGYSKEEATAMRLQNLIVDSQELEACKKDLMGCYGEVRPLSGKILELRAIRKGGQEFPLELSLSLLELEGEPHTLVISRDISKRKTAQIQKELEHRRFVCIFDSITDPIYVSDPVTYKILYVNKALEKALGRNPVGSLCYKEFQGLDHPCEFCTNVQILNNNGRPYYWTYYNPKMDKHFKIVDRIIPWPDGRDVRFEFAVDVSDLKKAEENLKKAHQKATLLLKGISSILIAMDEEDKIIEWNEYAERMLSIPAQQAIGNRLDELDIPWEADKILEGIRECKSNNHDVRIDNVVLRSPGKKDRILGMTIDAIVDEEGGFRGTMIRAADITEKILLERQLAQAQKLEAIGQLAAGIAHEINTPIQYIGDNLNFLSEAFQDLTALINEYENMLNQLPKDSPYSALIERLTSLRDEIELPYLEQEIPKALDQSLDGVARITKIVRAMKEFSHPGSSEKTPMDINHAIKSTVTITKNEWKYVADVETDLDPDLPMVPCLAGDINQVFLNLLVNSAHAIEAAMGGKNNGKGKIRVATRKRNGWAEITITDTGTGIPESIRDRIFDPFFTTKEVGKGTGQGLSIAYNIVVEKHGGIIDFETTEGEGTTFIVRLPLKGKG